MKNTNISSDLCIDELDLGNGIEIEEFLDAAKGHIPDK